MRSACRPNLFAAWSQSLRVGVAPRAGARRQTIATAHQSAYIVGSSVLKLARADGVQDIMLAPGRRRAWDFRPVLGVGRQHSLSPINLLIRLVTKTRVPRMQDIKCITLYLRRAS